MFQLGKRSQEKLEQANSDLYKLVSIAIKTSPIDFSVIESVRDERSQNEAYNSGYSMLRYPNSKHNSNPSNAVDIIPYPVDWTYIDRFKQLGKHIKQVAKRLNIDIEWGGDWRTFKDYAHYQQ